MLPQPSPSNSFKNDQTGRTETQTVCFLRTKRNLTHDPRCCFSIFRPAIKLLGLCLAALFFDAPLAVSQVNIPMKNSASELANKLRKLGVKKVAVLPLAFVEDETAAKTAQFRAGAAPNANVAPVRPLLSASADSLRVAEQMQDYLAEAGQGDFGVVPSQDLFERLSQAELDSTSITSTSKELFKIVNPDDNIGAIVVGTIQKVREMGGPEQCTYKWKILDSSDRTILLSKSEETRFTSLAEAVYNGQSAEYFRYQNGKLTCLFDFGAEQRNKIPLKPSDPNALYKKGFHPLLNPNCPFKVDFLVNDRVLPIHIATIREARAQESILDDAVINLEPGDEPIVRVTNSLAQRVMVAVFVDGVNILGKKRELPDETIHAWVLESKQTARFKSWWTGDYGKPVEEAEFVIEKWNDTVAGKMGLRGDAEASRAFTIVFFTEGFPKRQDIQFFPRYWYQQASLSNDRKRVFVAEQMERPGMAGAAADMFGMGAKAPKPGQLNWVQGVTVGTMLASMHVHYCPKSETKATFQRIIPLNRPWLTENSNFTVIPISMGR